MDSKIESVGGADSENSKDAVGNGEVLDENDGTGENSVGENSNDVFKTSH